MKILLIFLVFCGSAYGVETTMTTTTPTEKCVVTEVGNSLRLKGTSADAFIKTITDPAILQGPPESKAFERKGIILEASGTSTAKLEPSGLLRITPGKGGVEVYDGIKYIEFPNSTTLATVNPKTGETRSWLLARGVRPYSTDVNLNSGGISPQGYVSDVLLFEIVNGKAVYRSRILTSNVNAKFFFEDPRISILYAPDGTMRRIILSGTDYSPHVRGAKNPDVMNRYLTMDLDAHGVPQPPRTDKFGIPKFSNVSPFPRVIVDKINGRHRVISIDAKNATFAINELGQVIVRTRLRPDFNSSEMKALAGKDKWKYAEQVFVFNSYEEMTQYNWDHCLEDLFGKGPPTNDLRVKPVLAKTIVRDSEIRELYQDPRVVAEKGKGLGPGTPPVRVVRRGNQLFVSGGTYAKERFAGELPADFYLKADDPKFLTFDHEIRYFMDSEEGQNFLKRHYSLSVKQFGSTLTTIETYYGDAFQPKTPYELGHNSGIADLQHVYAMGWEIAVGADGIARVHLSVGVSDAHTEIVVVDLVTLLTEMAPGSDRRMSGQVYEMKPDQPK